MPEIIDVKAMSDDEFVKKYKKLVYKFVWGKYGAVLDSIKTTTGLDVEDLIQSGMIGLLKARRDFNPAYGCKFSTLAIPKIYGETTRAIIDNQKIKVTRDIFYLKGRIQREGLTEEKPEDISQQLGVAVEDVDEALQYQHIPSYLSEVMYSSGGEKAEITLESKLVDESSIRKTEEIEDGMLVNSFVRTLPDREMIVWDMHSQNKSQEEISNHAGVSQPHISRILKRINERAAAFGRAQGVAK